MLRIGMLRSWWWLEGGRERGGVCKGERGRGGEEGIIGERGVGKGLRICRKELMYRVYTYF